MISFASEVPLRFCFRYHGRHARPVDLCAASCGGVNVDIDKMGSIVDARHVYFLADDHGMNHFRMALDIAGVPQRNLHWISGGLPERPAKWMAMGRRRPPLPSVKIAAIIGCTGFGEALAIVTALTQLRREIRSRCAAISIDVFANPCSNVLDVFRLATPEIGCVVLPRPVQDLAAYDVVLHMTGVDWNSHGCLVDSALHALGIEPQQTKPANKRLKLKSAIAPAAASNFARYVRAKGQKLVLFSTGASSPVRAMPYSTISRMSVALGKRVEWVVIGSSPGLITQGFMDWSHLSRAFTDFVGIVSLCDAVVGVDSCIQAVADSLGKPAVVLFTCRDAASACGPYPCVVPIQVGDPIAAPGARWSCAPSLVAAAGAAWDNLDCNRVAEIFGDIIAATGRHPASSPSQVALVARSLDESRRHPSKPVGAIASACGVQPAHLSRIFSAVMGQTFRKHLLSLRMNRARDLIDVGRLSVKAAGIEAGYQATPSFTRAFRSEFGKPPSARRTP